jgi:hypothetical protein
MSEIYPTLGSAIAAARNMVDPTSDQYGPSPMGDLAVVASLTQDAYQIVWPGTNGVWTIYRGGWHQPAILVALVTTQGVEMAAVYVYVEVDFAAGVADRMAAMGMPRPTSLLDVWAAHSEAHARLSPTERQIARATAGITSRTERHKRLRAAAV